MPTAGPAMMNTPNRSNFAPRDIREPVIADASFNSKSQSYNLVVNALFRGLVVNVVYVVPKEEHGQPRARASFALP